MRWFLKWKAWLGAFIFQGAVSIISDWVPWQNWQWWLLTVAFVVAADLLVDE